MDTPNAENALILDELSPLERAMLGWLHEKSTRTGSAKTKEAYRTAILEFQEYLRRAGHDLDGDRRVVAQAERKIAVFAAVADEDVHS